MRTTFLIAATALGLVGCGNPATKSDDPIVQDPADDVPGASTPAQAETTQATLASTMPEAMFGQWHIDDLGRAPTAEDCDPMKDGMRDYDRLITVRDEGYSYFETGGRITEVHARTDSMIDATFDTTYADTPTSERRDFALQQGGTLAVNRETEEGVMKAFQYRRCPEG